MGTKNDPGVFDCYANAEPDEPIFVLLGRDKNAPKRVEDWADEREAEGEDPAKVGEARECAKQMRRFRSARIAKKVGREAPWLAENFALSIADAKLFLAAVDGDREKARRLAELAKQGNLGVDFVLSILAAA